MEIIEIETTEEIKKILEEYSSEINMSIEEFILNTVLERIKKDEESGIYNKNIE